MSVPGRKDGFAPVLPRLSRLVVVLTLLLAACILLSLAVGPAGGSLADNIRQVLRLLTGRGDPEAITSTIIMQIRLPRVILAGAVGAALALGGLVFQALLRNPLAEPYILGISGGSAIGAIVAMLLGLAIFPGVTLAAFGGSMAVLGFVMLLAAGTAGRGAVSRESLLLGGVMMNAFCAAVIMFLISLSRSTEVHHILFWLMGDLSLMPAEQLPLLLLVPPCIIAIFLLARPMNLLLLGSETAASMGLEVKKISMLLLVITSFMVSVVVSQSGLVGFVGLVIPHIFRLLFGPDHRLLVPACVLGGAAYLMVCDLLARTLPTSGEMPVGIVTALVGAPLFIYLLWRTGR